MQTQDQSQNHPQQTYLLIQLVLVGKNVILHLEILEVSEV